MKLEKSHQEIKLFRLPPIEIVSADTQINLRTYILEDAQEAFDLIDRNREFLSKYGEDTPAKYPDLASFQKSILHPKNPSRLRFAIRDKSRVIVGSINLTPQEEDVQEGEIGYYLGEEFQHHGYITRAINALSDHAFQNLGYASLFGRVMPKNEPSLNALGRAGYLNTGILDEKGRLILTNIK